MLIDDFIPLGGQAADGDKDPIQVEEGDEEIAYGLARRDTRVTFLTGLNPGSIDNYQEIHHAKYEQAVPEQMAGTGRRKKTQGDFAIIHNQMDVIP